MQNVDGGWVMPARVDLLDRPTVLFCVAIAIMQLFTVQPNLVRAPSALQVSTSYHSW